MSSDHAAAPAPPTDKEIEDLAKASLSSLYMMMDHSVLPHVRKRIEDYIERLKAKDCTKHN